MKQILHTILLWQMSVVLMLGASVEATVDDASVVEGNSVQLTLEARGDDVKFPTIHRVGIYPVEGVSNMTQSSLKMINGTITKESIKKQIIIFTPAKAMTIPPFSIEVDGQVMQTNPVDIRVVKSMAPTPSSSKKVTLDMVVNQKQVFVGEPILLSVFFNESRQVDLMKVEYRKPALTDFFVKEIGDEKTYKKDGYIVHELRYILTPKYEGNFTIGPAQAKIAERGRRKDDFFGTFFDTPVWSSVVSNSLTIAVKPSPEGSDLVGDLNLSEKIDADEVKANKPVNLTIEITGEGNLEDFDGFEYEIDGVTIYSDDAKVESHLVGDKLISSYKKKFVFIADHDFEIPSKSFTLFNFKTGKVETLQTQSHQITVKGGQAVAPTVIQSTKPQVAAEVNQREELQSSQSSPDSDTSSSLSAWMLLLAFAGGVAVTLGAVKLSPYIKWKRAVNPMRESEALKILYPHTNDTPAVEDMVRKLYAKKGGDKSVVIDKEELKVLIDRYNI